MYAFIVKNDDLTWDIYNTLEQIPDPVREERLANAVESGLPITGMVVTEYKDTATSGAIWDGEKFTGGIEPIQNPHTDWATRTQYAYLCDNTVLIVFYSVLGTPYDDKYQAVFSSETSIVKVPEDQTAEVGDIWDGEKVVNRVQ